MTQKENELFWEQVNHSYWMFDVAQQRFVTSDFIVTSADEVYSTKSGELLGVIDCIFDTISHNTVNLVEEWKYLKEKLEYYKEKEMFIRKHLVSSVFPVYAEGTNEKEVDGYIYKFRATMSRKLIVPNEVLEQKIENGELPNDLFKRKYELSKTVYNKLTPQQLDTVEAIIETKDNAPILSIEKAEKE